MTRGALTDTWLGEEPVDLVQRPAIQLEVPGHRVGLCVLGIPASCDGGGDAALFDHPPQRQSGHVRAKPLGDGA